MNREKSASFVSDGKKRKTHSRKPRLLIAALLLVGTGALAQKQQLVDPVPGGTGGGPVAGWYRVLPSGDVRGPCTSLILRNGEGTFVLWLVPDDSGVLLEVDQTTAKKLVGPCD